LHIANFKVQIEHRSEIGTWLPYAISQRGAILKFARNYTAVIPAKLVPVGLRRSFDSYEEFCREMIGRIVAIVGGLLWVLSGVSATGGVVRGTVHDENGEPVVFANVYLPETLEGDVTDQEGHFEIDASGSGPRTLVARCMGYEEVSQPIVVGQGPVSIELVLKSATIAMDTITVTASSFKATEDEGTTISTLEVLTTAGAAADVFRAIQTFPGVSQLGEEAGLFVRGGEASETVTILNGAKVAHPYKYESSSGGYFGTVSPFLLKGTYFSSGGFSARYGNALSGVLAMETQDMPTKRDLSLTLSLATASASFDMPLWKDRLGVRFSGNRTFTDYLFKLNGDTTDFSRLPQGNDLNLGLIARYADAGQLKLFAFHGTDDIGVEVGTPTYTGYFTNEERNRFYVLSWQDLFGQTLLQTSVSTSRFQSVNRLGGLDIDMDDLRYQVRTEASRPVSERMSFTLGSEWERMVTDLSGFIPSDTNDLSPSAGQEVIDTDYRTDRYGAYLEAKSQLSRLFLETGIRSDYDDQAATWTYGPRVSLGWRVGRGRAVKGAWGIYYQYPSPRYYDPGEGNPDLGPMRAYHYVLGYDIQDPGYRFRIEGYYKEYDRLLLNDEIVNYTNGGYGYASGFDLFLKRDYGILSGWLSYSYLHARRKSGEFLELTPPDFDITHNLTVASKLWLGQRMNVSTTYRYATGKPYTPAPSLFNSERIPDYHRADLSLSLLHSLFPGNLTVFFVSVSNIFDRKNIFDYYYSPDYSTRTEVSSTMGRMLYFGFSIMQ
jgi:vitamin B12 transporter